MITIAVLMTCYNRVSTTLDCLCSLFSQELPSDVHIDVFMVDDASPDKTGEKVNRVYPEVKVIKSAGNLYWSKGMRLAWDHASAHLDYDFYLWLNDDVKLKAEAIKVLLADYTVTKGVIVGSCSANEDSEHVSYGATIKPPTGRPEVGVKGMNGNLVLVPRDAYLRVGKICNLYYHQYGDYDYGWMLRRRGGQYYSSSIICGVCPEQPERYMHLAGRNLFARLKLLNSPKGFSLHDAVLYSLRNRGIFRAMFTFAHIIFNVVLGREHNR